MRLEPLCKLELSYREEQFYGGKFALVKAYGSNEGTAYAEGDGKVEGSRLKGRMRWVNNPHSRSDGVMQPDIHGVILTEDGAKVLFALSGRIVFKGDLGSELASIRFETEDARYQWLNNAFCIMEGVLDDFVVRASVYQCVNELLDEA